MKQRQKTLHISFNQDDEDMYFDIMMQSSRTLIPMSALVRHYVREGMKSARKSAISQQ